MVGAGLFAALTAPLPRWLPCIMPRSPRPYRAGFPALCRAHRAPTALASLHYAALTAPLPRWIPCIMPRSPRPYRSMQVPVL